MQAKIKIHRKKLTALYGLYCQLETAFTARCAHEELLYEHILEMRRQLGDMVLRDSEKNTLKLSSVQALAFCQLWSIQAISDHYVGISISSIIAEIDQARKSPSVRAMPAV